jgi:PrtD family type I secretion system ABC transporter
MLTIALVTALLAMAALDAIRARILIRGAMRLDRLLSPRLVEALIERAARRGKEASSQVLRDFDQFRGVLAGPSLHVLFDFPWTLLYLAALFLIHPLLGAVATVGGLVLLGLAFVNDLLTRSHLGTASGAATRAYAIADTMSRNADAIRTMGMAPGLTRHWQKDRDTMLALQAHASDVTGDLTASTRFSRYVLQSAMLAVGAWLVVNHAILPATIFAASVIMGRALVPIEQAITAWRQFNAAGQAAVRVRRLLDEEPPQPARTHLGTPEGRFSLDDISYLAPLSRQPILKNISLDLPAGESLGIVGASGAGKSTLLRIMMGAIAPTSGLVSLDGADLALWRREDLGRHIGYLPDHVGLFAGTIRDNIARFGDASDRMVIEAAERAGVHEMILGLPNGYETLLSGDARELSAGQRQRVGLARALLGNPRLVALDEPNAHVDTAGERALDEALADLKADGTTLLVVTHRQNLVNAMDTLLVLANGQIEFFGPRSNMIDALRKRVVRPVPATVEA